MAKKRKLVVPEAALAPQSDAAAGPAPAAGGHPPGSRKAVAAKKQRTPSHQHTDVAPTGLGQQLSSAPGRLSKEPLPSLSSSQAAAKWAPPAAAPSSCPHSPAAAVDLELARCAALEQLRHRLASLAAKAGLRNVPLLAFERWRFAAKWAEDEPQLAAAAAAGGSGGLDSPDAQQQQQQQPKQKQKQAASDPVIPFGSLPVAPELGLVSDLTRAGLGAGAAVDVATQLAAAAASAAAALLKRRQQLASGKAPGCGALAVECHKHSLDLTCGGSFVKLSRPAYGKLARLYRQHWIDRVGGAAAGQACTVGLPAAEAAAHLAALKAGTAAAAADTDADAQKPQKRKLSSAAAAAAGEASDGSSSDSSSDESEGEEADAAAAAAVAGAAAGSSQAGRGTGAAVKQELDAEAAIAELEQQQQQQQQGQGCAGGGAAGAGHPPTAGSSTREAFHARLFALLLRYKSIQGAGFQAAAGPSVFDLLRSQLAVGYECFASPLNAHFSRFGSAFPDVDAPFGSGGSFFRMSLKHGSYEVNPPFVPAILTAAAQHMLQLLRAAEASGSALAFVVLMPGWQEVPGWQALSSSSFNRHSLLLAAADHGYCDGASHQRKDLYRQSPYDSGVMFLQTSAAAKKWPVKQQLLQELQVAFAACCPTAAAAERQRKQRGHRDLDLKGHGVPVQKLPAGAAGDAAGLKRKQQKTKKKQKKKLKQQQQQQQKAAGNGQQHST